MKTPRLLTRALLGCGIFAVFGACAERGTPPLEPEPPRAGNLAIVAGRGQADSIQAILGQPLVVELRDTRGNPMPAADVTLYSEPQGGQAAVLFAPAGSDAFTTPLVAKTGADGRLSVRMRLDSIAGRATVGVRAADLTDTATITITSGKPVRIDASPRDTTLYLSVGYRLVATGRDRYRNPVPVQRTPSPRAAVEGEQVRSPQLGRHYVALQSGTVQDTARFSVVPPGVIAAQRGGFRPNSSTSFKEVVTLQLDGSNRQLVTGADWTHDVIPRWFAGGDSLLIFEDRPHTYVGKAAFGEPGMRAVNLRDLTPRWLAPTSDNAWIYLSASAEYQEAKLGYQIWRMRPDLSGAEMVTAFARMQFDHKPDVSPDGQRLAFVRGYFHGGPTELWIRDLATGVETRLADSVGLVRWSPSGTRIAYLTGGRLVIADAQGGTPQLVAAGISEFAWSPDGAHVIVAVAPQAGLAARLHVLILATGEAIPLSWSRDKDTYYRGPDWR